MLEGHVPAVAVRRLLAERPTAIGLSVPGMPAGSPGMEGGTPQRYDVILFGKTGRQPFMHWFGKCRMRCQRYANHLCFRYFSTLD